MKKKSLKNRERTQGKQLNHFFNFGLADLSVWWSKLHFQTFQSYQNKAYFSKKYTQYQVLICIKI